MSTAYFYIYETVTFPIQLSDTGALQDIDKIIVSLKQKTVQLDKENPDYNEQTGVINLYLTQEDTALFKQGLVDLQINLYYDDHERDVTKKVQIQALDNLYKKVIT